MQRLLPRCGKDWLVQEDRNIIDTALATTGKGFLVELLHMGLNPDASVFRERPLLHRAASSGNFSIVACSIDAGVTLNTTDENNVDAYAYIISLGYTTIANYLREKAKLN
ncbi:hypothetical protein K432DRAFT_395833 [Lepidopterella palustris CBS 459.81]|uniref:Ankyrin n=1 Tax=Lepidopterella palustris CBS 459.81 TaxID=1314670 RepID=A0A8E2E4E7_9PEZI|nr:hypothetical protein K432DRAFT_395833 [Lepidopterella palustris CBS 459.81]